MRASPEFVTVVEYVAIFALSQSLELLICAWNSALSCHKFCICNISCCAHATVVRETSWAWVFQIDDWNLQTCIFQRTNCRNIFTVYVYVSNIYKCLLLHTFALVVLYYGFGGFALQCVIFVVLRLPTQVLNPHTQLHERYLGMSNCLNHNYKDISFRYFYSCMWYIRFKKKNVYIMQNNKKLRCHYFLLTHLKITWKSYLQIFEWYGFRYMNFWKLFRFRVTFWYILS